MIFIFVIFCITIFLFFWFYMFSMDFFLVFNNNVLSYFKQSEIIHNQNFKLTDLYVKHYNQDNIWNNNWNCLNNWIIEDNDCNYLSLYWFISPNTQIDLWSYTIENDWSLDILITWNNTQWVDYRIIDITNWWEYNWTIYDLQSIKNLKSWSKLIVKLTNKNNNRNQYFIKLLNEDWFKKANITWNDIQISSLFNIKYWKNNILQNWVNSMTNFKQSMVAYFDMDLLTWDSIYDFSSNLNNLQCYSSWTLQNCSDFQDWPSLDEGVNWKWLKLDWIDDYVNAWPSSLLDFKSWNFSISFWIKPSELDTNQTIIRNWLIDSNYSWYKVWVITWWYLEFKVWDWSWAYLVNFNSINPIISDWNHVAISFNSLWESKIYINWTLDSIINFTPSIIPIENINNFIIWKGSVYEYFKWNIDELKLFNEEIDLKAVLSLYN